MEERKTTLEIFNPKILNLCKKTEDLRLNLRKKKIDEKLLDIMEKKYDQAKKINSLSTKLDELILPDDVKYKSFTDDSDFLSFVNLLLDNNSVDWKKFGLYILKLNLDHEHYNPNVMKFDSNLIPKIIIIIEKYFDDMNIVYEALSTLIILCNNLLSIKELEEIFLNETYLNIIHDLFYKKKLMGVSEILNLYTILINCLIKSQNHKNILNALYKLGTIDNLINLFDENKIHAKVLSNVMDLAAYIFKNRFQILNQEQEFKIVKNCLMYYQDTDYSIRLSCFWNICYISESENIKIIEEILKSDLIKYICQDYKIEPETIIPSIRIFGNLAGNDDKYIEFLIQLNILRFFKKCLPIENYVIKKEGFWALSNIVATSRLSAMEILKDEELVTIIKQSLFYYNPEVKEEVLYFLGNIIMNADYLLIRKFLDFKIEEDLIILLRDTKNPELLSLIFEMIVNLINLPFYKKKINNLDGSEKIQNEIQIDTNERKSPDSMVYEKIKIPIRDLLIKKGLIEILDKLTNHQNEDIGNLAKYVIECFKDDI